MRAHHDEARADEEGYWQEKLHWLLVKRNPCGELPRGRNASNNQSRTGACRQRTLPEGSTGLSPAADQVVCKHWREKSVNIYLEAFRVRILSYILRLARKKQTQVISRIQRNN